MSDRISTAMFNPSFPGNPIPFARGLGDFIKDKGTNAITSDDAKVILWVLMAQAYGQLATVDLSDEWIRLDKVFNKLKEKK